MSDDEFMDLVQRYLSNELDKSEMKELKEAMDASGERRTLFLRACRNFQKEHSKDHGKKRSRSGKSKRRRSKSESSGTRTVRVPQPGAAKSSKSVSRPAPPEDPRLAKARRLLIKDMEKRLRRRIYVTLGMVACCVVLAVYLFFFTYQTADQVMNPEKNIKHLDGDVDALENISYDETIRILPPLPERPEQIIGLDGSTLSESAQDKRKTINTNQLQLLNQPRKVDQIHELPLHK